MGAQAICGRMPLTRSGDCASIVLIMIGTRHPNRTLHDWLEPPVGVGSSTALAPPIPPLGAGVGSAVRTCKDPDVTYLVLMLALDVGQLITLVSSFQLSTRATSAGRNLTFLFRAGAL